MIKSAGALLLGSAAVGVALLGAGAANAQPGVVSVQSGGTVDVDGTQGTMVPATTGDERDMTAKASAPHSIVSDACAVEGGSYPDYGCLPPSSDDPRTISATTGMGTGPSSTMDTDGYQTNESHG